MRMLAALLSAGTLVAAVDLAGQQAPSGEVDIREWSVEWGGRTRDPYVGPEGRVWFVGQEGNYVAYFDPATESFRRYEIEDGTNPHNLIVDDEGFVWYSGNRNGRIGKLDPETGEVEVHMMPDPEAIRDPHTLTFDGAGRIWFTAQGASRVGRIHMETGEIEIVDPHPEGAARPYGIVVDEGGQPWLNLFNTPYIATVDPATLEVERFEVGPADARTRRIARTDDGMIWFVDYARGMLGRLNPESGSVDHWPTPGGAQSAPYGMAADNRGRIWFAETGDQKRLIGFDPATETFFSINDVSDNIRHMMFHEPTGTLWFGTDANMIGRAVVNPGVS